MKKLIHLFTVLLFITAASALITGQTTEKPASIINVAILVFDDVQIVDYTGPYEILGGARTDKGKRAFKVYTVSEKAGSITTNMGMSVNPTYNFENAPKPDILVVPGGGGLAPDSTGVMAQVKNPAIIKWVRDNARDAKIVMSVCNGAFIIAEAGLLDGLEATTTAGAYINALRKNYPKIREVVDDKRFVDNGKVITTAGLSSGFDGSLHLVEKLFGRVAAKTAALGIEYNWDPDSKYARAALADSKLPQSLYEAFYTDETNFLNFDGNADQWEESYLTPSTLSPDEMIQKLNEKWAGETNWTKAAVKISSGSASTTTWKFTDRKGQVWNATAIVQPGKEKNQLLVNLKVNRAS